MSGDFDAALNLVVARTGVERYRHLASGANTLPSPNSAADWRAWVLREAARLGAEAARPPGPWRIARNALAALWRVARARAAREPVRAPRALVGRRKALCAACPAWDRERARCTRCGCWTEPKVELATERCPDGRW